MAPDGTVIAAWVESPPSTCCAADRAVVNDLVVRTRPPGGPFGPPQIVDSGDPAQPQLGIDQSGRAVLAWTSNAGDRVNTAVRPPGGSFGDIQSYSGEAQAGPLKMSVDAQGNATLFWRRVLGPNPEAVRAGYRPVAGPLTPAQTVDTVASGGSIVSDHIQQLAFAGNAEGDAAAVWLHQVFDGSTTTSTFDGSRKSSGGSWGPPVPLRSSTDDLDAPAVAVDAAGNALAAWTAGHSTPTVEASFWPKGAAPGALENPAAGVTNPEQPAVAFDATGDAVLGWRAPIGGGFGLQHDIRSPGGAYGPIGTFTPAGFGLAFADNPGGELLATWNDDDQTPHASIRSPGTDFGATKNLPGTALSDEPVPALDPQGNGVAAWTQSESSETHAWVSGLDGAPPQLSGLSVSSPLIAGDLGEFNVHATDVWSPFNTIWQFGDGSSVSSGLAAHRYSKPGNYTATATATDAVGLSSAISAPVHVADLIGSFGITRHTFAVGPKATPIVAVKRGTTFRFRLAGAAQLSIAIGRKTRGVRVGKRCRPPRRHTTGKRLRRCTFFKAAGKPLIRHGKEGLNSFPFSGRTGHRALPPGVYRAVALARDVDGATSQHLVGFRIVPAAKRRH